MTTHTLAKLSRTALFAFVAAATIITMSLFTLLLAEPQISHSQAPAATDEFFIRQTITDETSFTATANDVTMDGDIAGLTGGNATGSTAFTVRTNNAGGYYVTIDFTDNAGAYAMRGDESGSEDIRDYSFASSSPSYNFTASTASMFAYTVMASTSSHVSDNFLNNTVDQCGVGASYDTDSDGINICWMTASTSEYEILNSTSPASNGATSTLTFKVHVPSGSVPVPSAESYTATATLSLYTQ